MEEKEIKQRRFDIYEELHLYGCDSILKAENLINYMQKIIVELKKIEDIMDNGKK